MTDTAAGSKGWLGHALCRGRSVETSPLGVLQFLLAAVEGAGGRVA